MKKVTIVGVGALGSHVVQFLRNEEVTLSVIDFDRVERKNVLSQFHGARTVGKSKVQALQQTMQFLYGRKVTGVPHRLTEDNQEALLGASHLIVDCLDNLPSRELVSRYATPRGIPCLHGALAPDGGFGRVVWDELFTPDGASEGAATCEDGAHLPFIGMVATHLAYAAQIFLTRGKKMSFSISPAGVVAL